MSISTAAMTAVCLGTTTYAWFSQNRNVWVEETDLYVNSYDGLLISLDGQTFSQDISTDALKQYITGANTVEEAKDAYSKINLIGTTMKQNDATKEVTRDADYSIMFGHDVINHTDNKYTNTVKLFNQVTDELVAYLIVETENDEIISFKAFDKDDTELDVDDSNKDIGEYIITKGSNPVVTIENFTVNSYVRENLTARVSAVETLKYIITYSDSGYSHSLSDSVANNNYLKFDLTFRIVSDNNSGGSHEDYELKFTDETFIKSEELAKAVLVNTLTSNGIVYNAQDEIEFDVANAMRVAVDSKDGLKIFEVTNEKDLGSVALEDSTSQEYDKNANAMYTYYNSIHPNYPFEKAASNGDRFKTEKKFEDVSLGKFEYSEVDGKYNDLKTTIYIWLEGWDADYFLGASVNSRKLSIKLDFKYKDED